MTAKIKLNAASGGGSFSLQAPSSSANNRVMTLPDTADGTILTTTNPKSGNILQVVQTMKLDTMSSTTSNTWTDITGVTVNITPSASSNKILVTYQGACSSSDDSYLWLRIARVIGGTTVTDLAKGTSRGSAISCTVNGLEAVEEHPTASCNHTSFEFLDSPNTTSQITYKMQFYKAMGSHFFIGGTYGSQDANKGSVPTFLTVKEVGV